MAPRVPAGLRLSGAVPLDPKPAPSSPGAARPPGGGQSPAAGASAAAVLDVTEATFADDVVARSREVPVVIDFWASWCGPCRQLSPVLERLATEANGAWVLAKIDVDANPRLAQAAGVQGIPAVKAVLDGQIVGEFTGALPEPQVRQWLGELLEMTGQLPPNGADGAQPGPPPSPAHGAAMAALQRNDLDGAAAAYRQALADDPADSAARSGLARVELLRRVQTADERSVRAKAAASPDDVPSQLGAADFDLLSGHVEDAFGRLVELIRRTDGAERDSARARLIELFDVLGPDDPRVQAGRRKLANALF